MSSGDPDMADGNLDTASMLSAVYSGRYNTTFTTRNRWSTSSPDESDECCLECCCGICTCVGYVFCFKKMSRATRIEILWAWLAIMALTGGLVSSMFIFGPFKQKVASTDMRSVDQKLSPLFCDSITLDSDTEFSGYVFDLMPPIDTHTFQKFEQHEKHYLESSSVKHWQFYLLQQSVITILSCADTILVEFLVFKGKDNFDEWRKNSDCSSCILTEIIINKTCYSGTNINVTVTIQATDEYYFVYNNYFDDTWIGVDFHVKRTLYDTSTATDSCFQGLECNFDLDLNSNQVVIYHMSEDKEDDLTITSKCNARIWLYMTLFGASPIAFGIALSIILYMCCKDPNPRLIRSPPRPLPSFPNERTPLLQDVLSQAEVPQPPKYEDIVRQDAPPSYAQATGQ